MTTILIDGLMGAGKNTLSTFFARLEREEGNRPIYSNYKIKSLPYCYFSSIEHLIKDTFPSLEIMDEAYLEIESRRSSNKMNLFYDRILRQSRKRKRDFIVISQIYNSIDVRFRVLADYRFTCTREEDGFNVDVQLPYGVDEWEIINDFFISDEFAKVELWPYFDTEEEIEQSNEELLYSIMDKREILKECIPYCDELYKKYSGRKIGKAVIENYCIKKELTDTHADIIYGEYMARTS